MSEAVGHRNWLTFLRFTTNFLSLSGLAGLAAAHALASAGHYVHLFEKSTQMDHFSTSGFRITPNGSKILQQWGIWDELKKLGCKLPSCEFIDREWRRTS